VEDFDVFRNFAFDLFARSEAPVMNQFVLQGPPAILLPAQYEPLTSVLATLNSLHVRLLSASHQDRLESDPPVACGEKRPSGVWRKLRQSTFQQKESGRADDREKIVLIALILPAS
jgi:hypothetical protein